MVVDFQHAVEDFLVDGRELIQPPDDSFTCLMPTWRQVCETLRVTSSRCRNMRSRTWTLRRLSAGVILDFPSSSGVIGGPQRVIASG